MAVVSSTHASPKPLNAESSGSDALSIHPRRILTTDPARAIESRRVGEGIILVVDDEVQVARSIKRVLSRVGFDVRIASSATEAMTMLDDVDLVLTDIRMPQVSGYELVARVREVRPELRCCLMSGDAGARGTADQRARFAHGRIDKPFTNDALVAFVSAHIDSKARRES